MLLYVYLLTLRYPYSLVVSGGEQSEFPDEGIDVCSQGYLIILPQRFIEGPSSQTFMVLTPGPTGYWTYTGNDVRTTFIP